MKKLLMISLILTMAILLAACFDGGDVNDINDYDYAEEVYNNTDIAYGPWTWAANANQLAPSLIGEWVYYGTYAGGDFFPVTEEWSVANHTYIFYADGSAVSLILDSMETFYWATAPWQRDFLPYGAEDFENYGLLVFKDSAENPLTTRHGDVLGYDYFISYNGLLSLNAWYATGETPVFRKVQ